VTNENSNDVSVVDLAERSVKATLPVGVFARGTASHRDQHGCFVVRQAARG
jgi:DNA-binding beta-propeller fold protein YncE